ncbi:MAG: hypothetical protein ACOC1K_04205 [Nanoarchaeota archaeon]
MDRSTVDLDQKLEKGKTYEMVLEFDKEWWNIKEPEKGEIDRAITRSCKQYNCKLLDRKFISENQVKIKIKKMEDKAGQVSIQVVGVSPLLLKVFLGGIVTYLGISITKITVTEFKEVAEYSTKNIKLLWWILAGGGLYWIWNKKRK